MDTATRIAVIYTTAQGSTREVAEFIGASLAARGATVAVAAAAEAPELARFDAVILGSAVHDRDLLPELTRFVRAHLDELRARPVWMFSVGLGPALVGPIGRRIGRVIPKKIADLRDSVAPNDYRAFAGRYERAGVPLTARTIYRLIGGPRYGDLRDWTAITGWTDTIAQELKLPLPQSTPTHP
ncbi:flavodoxin domain-containing protein [Nocardia seriolae]|uniref:Protoporphyrinogen IX dehydrogenase (Menaquinone) n=1 Tax=Nocardia seriolae TaxID=37332 RepID=A0A0B8N494_9NOCA|nr:flavodoxin domain-containing protein [Nocardia seriolae]APA98719.1 Protoporphyrinogen IX dehydrogenase (menaquinone) [Nocardia seriolae]MTJ63793.1 flavodoxin [Nocardia seriolae]MTJ72256.1 flavodoxin [Nocardia seriolae]MTJ88355.1 flavodoxin [Nocardia seriolae]MTK32340.1 flavodoxin [Nocardia seriolae]